MSILQRKDIIVIVDGWSGGKYLIPAFQSLGYFCMHVQSQFVPAVFDADNRLAIARSDRHVVHDGDFDALLATLTPYSIRAVLPGSESGVLLADQINDALGLSFANEFKYSHARRDKHAMQARIAQAGLASIEQCLVEDRTALRAWLARHDRWPVVVKPVQSAGTDGVAICHTIEQADAAFASIVSRHDLFGRRNASALCQAYLDGEEYVVNGVACDGRCFFTELWHSTKRQYEGVPVYETQYLRYRDDAVFDALTAYAAEVCKALGIRNGPFHAEIMLTARGPVLIEIGARIAGGADPYVIEQCLGHSQVSKVVQAVVRPDEFLREQADPQDHRGHRRAAYIFMISPYTGVVRDTPEASFIAIDGVISVNYHHVRDDIQQRTRDLMSSPGVVIALGADATQLDHTIAAVRAAEAAFYQENLIQQA
ncbi:ATP-grasp domain-containing protein [Burkholderia sp. LMG 21824]|uniref:ATP-grasp domain-containing protein n=1 Tax=Burkholderia sp. LMG 21824 TaxID=3158172 RepID=UPI003C2B5F0E